jgi:hypothetical protein
MTRLTRNADNRIVYYKRHELTNRKENCVYRDAVFLGKVNISGVLQRTEVKFLKYRLAAVKRVAEV